MSRFALLSTTIWSGIMMTGAKTSRGNRNPLEFIQNLGLAAWLSKISPAPIFIFSFNSAFSNIIIKIDILEVAYLENTDY